MSNLDSMKNIRLGDVLIAQGCITQAQLDQALEHQQRSRGKRLGAILEELGFVTQAQKLDALGRRLDIPVVGLSVRQPELDAVALIPQALAAKYCLIALEVREGQLVVATGDPLNFFAIEEVRQAVRMPITLCLATEQAIEAAIVHCYAEVGARQAVTAANLSLAEEAVDRLTFSADTAANDAPVVRLLSSLLVRGLHMGASDIHIEPFEQRVNVRMRVDGALVDYTTLAASVHQPLVARIKVLSGLDIAEKRVPQDGHFRTQQDGHDLSLRVSLVPTVFGEKAVLRFLSTRAPIDHASSFGMADEPYRKVRDALHSPHGVIYITGPTGSGKTTTLYMMLEHLMGQPVNIATIEDPVERNIPRVSQMQVNNVAGLTFDAGLRAILRQDPDIIMVGETRDTETARISVRSAITGHLVLSTLHTNDAVSAIVRLRDMGIEPYLIASAMVAVVAQRLVRKICPDCGYDYTPTAHELAAVGGQAATLRRGKGCPTCSGTGYKGRVAVHEVVLVDRALRGMITAGASSDAIFDYVRREQAMQTLRDAAAALVLSGVTTVDELLKVAYHEGY